MPKGPTDGFGRKVKVEAPLLDVPEPPPVSDPDWRTGTAKPDHSGTANQRMAALIEDQAAMGRKRPWEVGK